MLRRIFSLTACGALGMALAGAAVASEIWVNTAGTPTVQGFDSSTGAKVAGPFNGGGTNGRGVVVVGSYFYTTEATTGTIRKFDRATGTLVSSCNVAGANGISTIGFDGTNFWTSDYTGSNKAYQVDGNCTLLKTITLSQSQGFYDGLEYFNGKLIANRFDGGFTGGNQYSVYDTDGNLLVANFIDTTGHGNGTGIAFDGTNFYISDIYNGRVTEWDGTTGAYLGFLTLVGVNQQGGIEDLSFDYQQRPDTCRVNCNAVPEPGTLSLMGIAILASGLATRRRRHPV